MLGWCDVAIVQEQCCYQPLQSPSTTPKHPRVHYVHITARSGVLYSTYTIVICLQYLFICLLMLIHVY